MTRRVRGEDDDNLLTYLGVGSAHSIAEPQDEDVKPAGRLFVPDPEQRHGWREFYVKPAPVEKPGTRPLGFGRP
jgi:hypothetical protein